MNQVLNPDLHAALTEYRNACAKGSDIRFALHYILENFRNQSPNSVAKADYEIAHIAGLFPDHSPKRNFWDAFMLRPRRRELFLANPGLEYLFIFHPDVQLRQEALNFISGPLPNAFVMSALCRRLDDWVAEVQVAAERCALRCFEETKADILCDFLLATVRQRRGWKRWSESYHKVVTRLLGRTDVIAEMAARMLTRGRGRLPSLMAYLMRYPDIDHHLKRLAADATHPEVRAQALRALINAEASFAAAVEWLWIDKMMGRKRRVPQLARRALAVTADRKQSIRQGLLDKSAVVRRSALTGIIAHELDNVEFQKAAFDFIHDSYPSVRERAAFIVKSAALKR